MLRLTRLASGGCEWPAPPSADGPSGTSAASWSVRREFWRGIDGLHLIKWPVLADRHAGFRSRSFISSTWPTTYSLFRDEDFDVVCDKCGWRKDDWHWRGLIDLLMRADIRVAFFDALFFSPHAGRPTPGCCG